MIRFNCSQCNHAYRVPDEYAGKKARCKECRNVNIIPELEPEQEFDFSLENFDSGAEYHEVFQELLKWEQQAPTADIEEM